MKFIKFILWRSPLTRTIYTIVGSYLLCYWYTTYTYPYIVVPYLVAFMLLVAFGAVAMAITAIIAQWKREYKRFK